jgi:hypothetical protein
MPLFHQNYRRQTRIPSTEFTKRTHRAQGTAGEWRFIPTFLSRIHGTERRPGPNFGERLRVRIRGVSRRIGSIGAEMVNEGIESFGAEVFLEWGMDLDRINGRGWESLSLIREVEESYQIL